MFRLVLILQTERASNARELAERCEVSRRTIYRDMELLAEAGIPVRYRAERQGYELARNFFLPPTSFDEAEAQALLIMVRQTRWGDGLGLLRHAWGGAIKLVQTLPPGVRERVLSAAEPFRAETSTGKSGTERQAVYDTILRALREMRQIRVWYRPAGCGGEVCSKLSVYRVLLNDRHWFMVGRSSLHRRVEVVGVHWVQSLVMTDEPYKIPPRFDLERFLGQSWGVERHPVRSRVWLRFDAQVASELNDVRFHRTERKEVLADGRVDLHFVVEGIDEILRWVLGFGDQVEVLEPAELRSRVFQVASGVASRHQPNGPGVSRATD